MHVLVCCRVSGFRFPVGPDEPDGLYSRLWSVIPAWNYVHCAFASVYVHHARTGSRFWRRQRTELLTLSLFRFVFYLWQWFSIYKYVYKFKKIIIISPSNQRNCFISLLRPRNSVCIQSHSFFLNSYWFRYYKMFVSILIWSSCGIPCMPVLHFFSCVCVGWASFCVWNTCDRVLVFIFVERWMRV